MANMLPRKAVVSGCWVWSGKYQQQYCGMESTAYSQSHGIAAVVIPTHGIFTWQKVFTAAAVLPQLSYRFCCSHYHAYHECTFAAAEGHGANWFAYRRISMQRLFHCQPGATRSWRWVLTYLISKDIAVTNIIELVSTCMYVWNEYQWIHLV